MRISSARAAALVFASPALASPFAPGACAAEANEVSVYRQPCLIDPLFKAFTEETGIKVNVIFAEKGLNERRAAEGRNSPAVASLRKKASEFVDKVGFDDGPSS
jgi:iron(III) transport system substrate-binding protein